MHFSPGFFQNQWDRSDAGYPKDPHYMTGSMITFSFRSMKTVVMMCAGISGS